MADYAFIFFLIGGAIGYFRASKRNEDKALGAIKGGLIGALVGFVVPMFLFFILFGVFQIP